MKTPNLSQFHTLIRAHALINRYSKSELFLNNALDIEKLGSDLLAYRQWWIDQRLRMSKRHFIISMVLLIMTVANLIAVIAIPNNGLGMPLGFLIIGLVGWNYWAGETIETRLAEQYEASGYPHLSQKEVEAWIELMQAYVEVHADDNDELWNQAIIKINTIRSFTPLEKLP